MNFSVYSNKGNSRSKNEDDYLLDINKSSYSLIAVADGMGGYQAGEVASKIAINEIADYKFDINLKISGQINNIINSAHKRIIEFSGRDNTITEMGTTLTFGLIYNYKIYIGHVGDSRIYLYRNQALQQLTTDHSLVNELLQTNSIDSEEAFNHPQRNLLTQAVGLKDNPAPELKEIDLFEDDILLFCTDGLSDMLRFHEIKSIIADNRGDIESLSEKLGEKAMGHGGKDNLTLIAGIIN